MQANANSKTARKRWAIYRIPGRKYLTCWTERGDHDFDLSVDITGASPAYVEAVVEEINIRINEILYNLGRIAV